MELLVKHFGQVHTLKDWLQTILGDDNHTTRSVLIQNSDDESYRRLLTCVFVCEDTKICCVPNITASHYHPQKEIVLTAIQRILSKKGYGKNVLTNGFCLMSADPFALSCGVNVESRYPNSCVNRLFYPAWEMLLARAGETAMMFLLEHMSLFYQVTPTCMVQISGAPINNSVETVAHKVKRTTPVKQQVQNSNEIEVTAEDRKNADEEYEIEKLQEDSSDNLKEINSRKVGECSMACSGTSQMKRNSNNGSKTNKVIFEDIKGVEQVDLCVKRSKQCNKHKRKNDCNVIKKIVKGKKKRKYEQVHENRFLELKRRSEIYASRGKLFVDQTLGELDNEMLEDIQSSGSAKGVAGELKEVHTLKRKVGDTDLENGDEMEDVDHEFESKRRRLQSRSDRCTEDATNVRLNEEEMCDKDVVETGKVTSYFGDKKSKYCTTDGTTVSKTPKKRRKCKRKHSKFSQVKDECRPFCPFEFQLALPKNGILFSRNPRERFTQSVLLSRLGTTSEDILLLYKEIFCETNVLSDTESVRVTSPDLYSLQRALGISVETGMTENLERDSLQNRNSADLNPHPSFWNESSGNKALLPDSSGTCALIETSKCGGSKLCSDLSTNPFSDTNGKDSNDSVEMVMCEVCEKGNEEAVVTKLKGDNSKSFESVGVQDRWSGRTSCETCNSRCGKEALLVKRKHEIVLSRRNAESNRFVKNSPTLDTVFIQPGRKEVEEDIQFRNYNRSNTGCLHASSETTEMQMLSVNPCSVRKETSAVLREKEGDSKILLHVGTSQNSATEFGRQSSDYLFPSPHSAQDVCTSQQSRRSLCASQHSAQDMSTSQHSSQSLCASQHSAQDMCTSQHSAQDVCTSQHSVQSVSKQTVDIPVFTGIVPLLQQLIEKHRRCPFKALLKHHCPALCKKTASGICCKKTRGKKRCRGLTVSQLLSNHHHHRQVYLFLRACIVRVLPVQLLGTRHNLNILLKNVSRFISLGKYDRLTLGQVMHGLKTSEVEWLRGTSANSVKLHLLARLVFWLFGYILVMLKTFFYVTDTGFLRYKLLYFRQVTWNKLHLLGIKDLINRKILKIISEKKAWEMVQGRDSLGVSLLRFLPKQRSLRPIINMGSAVTLNSFQAQPVNKQLSDLHCMLTYLKTRNPSLIGHGKLGTDDIYDAWKSFVQQWTKIGAPKLYFVKTDISNCYDSVRQDKMYSIMENILNTEMNDEDFVIRKYFTVSMKNGHVQRKFHRVVTPMAEFNPDFMAYSKQIAEKNGLMNTVFVDKVVYQHETCETLKRLLKIHLSNNLIKIGNHYYLQRCGISQGSVISTLLCSFYYAEMEKKLFQLTEGEFLMRIVDDYLYVTPTQAHAVSFLETMIKGVPEYNCSINREKILTNFPYEDNYRLPSVSAEWFPWCGVLFNSSTLEVSMDFTKYSGVSIMDTMTMELSKTPGKSLKEKIAFSVRQKCHALFIDATINSETQMLRNLYQQFLLAVFKLHAYIQNLHYKQRAESNTKYVLGVIWKMIYVVYSIVKKHVTGNGSCDKHISNMISWLCLKASYVKLSRHHAQYKHLLKDLRKHLKHRQEHLTPEEEAVLRIVVEPNMPEAFQSFLA